MALYDKGTLRTGDAILFTWERDFFSGIDDVMQMFDDADTNMQIYMVDENGVQQVTDSNEYDGFIALWSADGSEILIEDGFGDILHPDFKPPQGVTVRYAALEGNPDVPARFSPDGKFMAYPVLDEGIQPQFAIKDVKADSVTILPILPSDWLWLPDSSGLVLIPFDAAQSEFRIYNLDGSLRETTSLNFLDDAYEMTLSPTLQHIAYGRGDDTALFISNIDGSREVQVGQLNVWESPPVWSPKGDKLTWVNESVGNYERELMVADADGSNIKKLLLLDEENDGEVVPGIPVWSPDGKQIAIGSFTFNDDFDHDDLDAVGTAILVVNADGSHPMRVTDPQGLIFSGFQWRPRPST